MSPFLTPAEEIVINLVFEWLGETRVNRTMSEYIEIARKVPKVDAVYAYANERLPKIAATGAPYEICDFKPGDAFWKYRPFPRSVSRETVRTAMAKFGIFTLRASSRPTSRKSSETAK